MKIREIMTRDVEVVQPESNLKDAARKMELLNVGILPVCDGERLAGMLTDRDITIRAVASGKDPDNTPVDQVMTKEIVFCYEDQEVEEAARIMEAKQIRRLAILNREKNLTGIVSLGDLAVKNREDRLSGEILERISEPVRPSATGAYSSLTG